MRTLLIALGVLTLVGCSKTPVPVQSNTAEPTTTSTAIDTATIISKISQSTTISTDSLTLSKYVTGPETEKYLLLAEMQEIRNEINSWNQQIVNLQFRFESGMSMMMPTWDADIKDHADASIHINNLILKYESIVEKLLEGDFNGSGTFYEVKAGKSTYWVFESSGGAITKTMKRK